MNVVFLSPAYPPEMQQYVRGLVEVGARVLGVGDTPRSSLPRSLAGNLADYLEVPRILDEDAVLEQVSSWLRGRPVDRIVTNWEVLVHLAARLRERLKLPGMSPNVVQGFRDKQLMKERVKAAGIRVPHSFRIQNVEELRTAAKEIGFPIIVKPIAGAGSANTYRIDSEAGLEKLLPLLASIPELSCEEFIDGEEFTYDTVSIDGVPVYENVSAYLPSPLIARTNEWVSPIIITVRDLSTPKISAGMELGRKVLKALQMGDGFSHMEWYRTNRGEVVFGEIGCRPGGANLVDQMNYTSDIDLFREWARVICEREFHARRERLYNTAIIFKRAQGQGRITRITGLVDYLRIFKKHVVAETLLRPGTTRRNWLTTLLSDGFIIVRHPDWGQCLAMARAAATGINLYASPRSH